MYVCMYIPEQVSVCVCVRATPLYMYAALCVFACASLCIYAHEHGVLSASATQRSMCVGGCATRMHVLVLICAGVCRRHAHVHAGAQS